MTRHVVHPLGLSLLSILVLLSGSCRSALPAEAGLPEPQVQATAPLRDRGLELTTLRAELAAARIAAAKKEAELLELRDLVQQLRRENAESRQAVFDLRDQAEQRQYDVDKARDTQARQTQARSTQDFSQLTETVAMLAQDLAQLKQDLAKPVEKEQVTRPVAMTVTTATVPDRPSIITVQPGDTLASLAKRHRTTVETLRKLNVLKGDVVVVGHELILPASHQP